jgi:hypothetical protein
MAIDLSFDCRIKHRSRNRSATRRHRRFLNEKNKVFRLKVITRRGLTRRLDLIGWKDAFVVVSVVGEVVIMHWMVSSMISRVCPFICFHLEQNEDANTKVQDQKLISNP